MMIHNAQEFLEGYGWESDVTAKVLGALTDESLSQSKADGHNTLGDIAWHIATAPAMMLNEVKYEMPQFPMVPPEGVTAAQILETYNSNVALAKDKVSGKTPEELSEVHHVFGMMDWPVSMMLGAIIVHEIHHRGQVSVLLRQAGLGCPSIYGPNHEETLEFMAKMQQGQGG